ncbi:MAG: hypothetical protein ACHREM_00960 [Polyangiales bacterium]
MNDYRVHDHTTGEPLEGWPTAALRDMSRGRARPSPQVCALDTDGAWYVVDEHDLGFDTARLVTVVEVPS